MSMVDFSEFHEFVQELDPLYRIPCRIEFGAAADKMFVDLKSILNVQLTDAGKIAFTTDIWTKIGMTSSFLGVTAHWFDRKSQTKKRLVWLSYH